MVLGSVLISFFYLCVCAKSLRSCPNLCNPMDWSPPGFSVHGILQAGILDGVSLLQGSSWHRDQSHNFCLPALKGRFFTSSAIWEAPILHATVHFPQHHLSKRLSFSPSLRSETITFCIKTSIFFISIDLLTLQFSNIVVMVLKFNFKNKNRGHIATRLWNKATVCSCVLSMAAFSLFPEFALLFFFLKRACS